MEQQLIGEVYTGTTIHFERHLKRWKTIFLIQVFFLLLSICLILCYFAKNKYRFNGEYDIVPIIVGLQSLIQIFYYSLWRWKLKSKTNFMKLASYLKQEQMIQYQWNCDFDMHYYYRYEWYGAQFKQQLKLGYFFRFYMYKKYGYFLFMILIICSIISTVYFFQEQFFYVWQIMTAIGILFLIISFDILSTITYSIYYPFSICVQNYNKKQRLKQYSSGLLDSEHSSCAICLQEYEKGEWIYFLPCNKLHHFHRSCLRSWVDYQQICPYCRQEFQFIQ